MDIRRLIDAVQIQMQENTKIDRIFDMTHIGSQRFKDCEYEMVIRGPSNRDRKTPHIHIYKKDDASSNYKNFNIEVSLVRILCFDDFSPIYMHDESKNLTITNKKDCSWTGYPEIYEGFINFLFSEPSDPMYSDCSDNLEAMIKAWNREYSIPLTNAPKGVNFLLDYLTDRNLTVLDKYQKYFDKDGNFSLKPNEQLYVNAFTFLQDGKATDCTLDVHVAKTKMTEHMHYRRNESTDCVMEDVLFVSEDITTMKSWIKSKVSELERDGVAVEVVYSLPDYIRKHFKTQ